MTRERKPYSLHFALASLKETARQLGDEMRRAMQEPIILRRQVAAFGEAVEDLEQSVGGGAPEEVVAFLAQAKAVNERAKAAPGEEAARALDELREAYQKLLKIPGVTAPPERRR